MVMEAALRADHEPDERRSETSGGSATARIALYPGGRYAGVAAVATVIVSVFAFIVFAAVMVRYVVSPPPALRAAQSASYR